MYLTHIPDHLIPRDVRITRHALEQFAKRFKCKEAPSLIRVKLEEMCKEAELDSRQYWSVDPETKEKQLKFRLNYGKVHMVLASTLNVKTMVFEPPVLMTVYKEERQ